MSDKVVISYLYVVIVAGNIPMSIGPSILTEVCIALEDQFIIG